MVQNLNILTFAPYGRLLGERTPTGSMPPDCQPRLLTVTEDTSRAYTASGPVYLDFDSGMAILAVGLENEPFRFFYLDKPLRMDPGVRFAVVPYQKTCSVRMAVESGPWPEAEPLNVNVRELALSRRIQVERVHTFFYHEKEPGFFFRGESHSMLELTYVDKGAVHSVADGQDLLLRQGDMTIYGPNQWHMQYADPDCAPSYITITFDLSGDSLLHLLNRKFRPPQKAVLLLRELLKEREVGDCYTGDMLICLLGQLLLTVLRGAERSEQEPLRTTASINSENDMVEKALRFIAVNVRGKLSVPAVAHAVGLSPSYLTTLFHKSLQISPGEYIRRAKLEEARAMIREGNMNFTEISRVLHYSTIHHFSRQFKDKFGITPTEYARSIR